MSDFLAMTERPILFSSPMVRAILEGRKSQTRRVVKPQPPEDCGTIFHASGESQLGNDWKFQRKSVDGVVHESTPWYKCPYGKPGDRLWVRETHYRYGQWLKNGLTPTGKQKWKFKPLSNEIHYFTDEAPENVRPNSYRKEAWYKRPSIFLPKDYHRITLEITDIRVERVQEISIIDCFAEGIPANEETNPKPRDGRLIKPLFRALWDSINSKPIYSWDDNPWVWVVEFKVLSTTGAPHAD